MKRLRTLLAMLLLALASYGAAVGPATIEKQELVCEEAAAALDGCCDDFDPTVVSCQLDGCDKRIVEITEDESTCIREMSCDDIRSHHVCERVTARSGAIQTDAGALVGPDGGLVESTVCP